VADSSVQTVQPADRSRQRVTAAIAAALVVAAAVIELAMGRVPICRCGYVKFWHGVVFSAENSQHLTDWYTFSHIIHGIGFYALLWLFARWIPPRIRFLIAVLLEASWEVVENTPAVIEHYRAVTISLDYYGDSVINSVFDIAAMMSGYWLAKRIPAWTAIVLVVLLEIGVAMVIRDNLTLNIIMLLHPVDAIRQWQSAAGS
jgi:hypothetical protein